MILNNLSFSMRNLRKNKLLAAINIFGLSIGISACLMIFLIADYELAFDRFQPDRDRIYRIYSKFPDTFNSINPGVPTALPVAVDDNFTGIESLTNFHTFSAVVKVSGKNGNTKELSVDEVKERYPESDIQETEYETDEVYSAFTGVCARAAKSCGRGHVQVRGGRENGVPGDALLRWWQDHLCPACQWLG